MVRPKPTPPPKRRARCKRCNNELLAHKPTGILACAVCDLVSLWPTSTSAVRSIWRPALLEDRNPTNNGGTP